MNFDGFLLELEEIKGVTKFDFFDVCFKNDSCVLMYSFFLIWYLWSGILNSIVSIRGPFILTLFVTIVSFSFFVKPRTKSLTARKVYSSLNQQTLCTRKVCVYNSGTVNPS